MRSALGLGRVAHLLSSKQRSCRAFQARDIIKRKFRPTQTLFRRTASCTTQEEHNAVEAKYFAEALPLIRKSITPAIEKQLKFIVNSVPGLSSSSRVLDAGCGDGILIPHLQARGVRDILAVDVTPEMIEALRQQFCLESSTLGNEPCVRTWVGDVVDIPAYQGPFDAVIFNAVFGNLLDQHQALTRACFLMRPGGHLVVSHPLGKPWLEKYRSQNPEIVPNTLPSQEEWQALTHDLPLSLQSLTDSPELYMAVLQVPEGYAHPQAPIRLAGPVVAGFGRGSKQLGVPTANIAPEPLEEQLRGLPTGVYFGWARLEAGPGAPAADGQVYKMVMNIGRRPTFEDTDPQITVEVHAMHNYASDFYGSTLRVVVLGFIRPEVKFSGVEELLARINTDIGIARSQLDSQQWLPYQQDPFLQ